MQRYKEERKRLIETCVLCGACNRVCDMIPLTDLKDIDEKEIARACLDALQTKSANEIARIKSETCMECFRCTTVCPKGLDPMMMNHMLKECQLSDGTDHSSNAEPYQYLIADAQVTASEWERITTERIDNNADIMFFPGCNVYQQPEKLLIMLDIMDLIGEPYSYLPGVKHCCGENHAFMGKIIEGEVQFDALAKSFDRSQAKRIVLWCPTCFCRIDQMSRYDEALNEIEYLSFLQYLLEYQDRLLFQRIEPQSVTLHEACKTSYTDLDTESAKELLSLIPGLTLVELSRNGKQTVCCGSGAVCHAPEVARLMRDSRLAEAAKTGADALVDVCHYCHEVFAPHSKAYGLRCVNLISVLGCSLGIVRDDLLSRLFDCSDMNDVRMLLRDTIEDLFYKRESVEYALSEYLGL